MLTVETNVYFGLKFQGVCVIIAINVEVLIKTL